MVTLLRLGLSDHLHSTTSMPGALVVLGDRLGLYRALAEIGSADSAQLARSTRLEERYVRECLANQAASGYVNYDPKTGCFSMSAEQKAVFADPESPVAMTGGFYAAASVYHDEQKVAEAFRTIFILGRSNGDASAHARVGSPTSHSRPPQPKSFLDATTSSRPLTRCTTWAIRWERQRTRANASRPMVPG